MEHADDLVSRLSEEGAFVSQGEFGVDLVRARAMVEQHLGLTPNDYLAFLVEALSLLDATRLRLEASWNRLRWCWDGRTLSRGQMEALTQPEGGSRGLDDVCQRLQLALFLLSRSLYAGWALSSGIGERSWRIDKQKRRVQSGPQLTWGGQLDITLPLSRLPVSWLVGGRDVLRRLPEVQELLPRLESSPIELDLPWKARALQRHPGPFAVRLQGGARVPDVSPWPADTSTLIKIDGELSAWFVADPMPGQRAPQPVTAVVNGLGYSGPGWMGGRLYLYTPSLSVDLPRRNLVQGVVLERVLARVAQELGRALLSHMEDPELSLEISRWALLYLTECSVEQQLGPALAQLPLLEWSDTTPVSLKDLEQQAATQHGLLYTTTHLIPSEALPRGARPLVLLTQSNAELLRSRFPGLTDGNLMLQRLGRAQQLEVEWRQRQPEQLQLPEGSAVWSGTFPPNWSGAAGITPAPSSPRLDLFREQRWLLALHLPSTFPPGYLALVQHPDLPLNETWTAPADSPAWQELLAVLSDRLPGWLAGQLHHPWLLDRALHVLTEHRRAQKLYQAPLIPLLRGQRISLDNLRHALEQEEEMLEWLLSGWTPGDKGWKLLHKAVPDDDRFRSWRRRLEQFAAGVRRWSALPPIPARLPGITRLVAGSLPAGEWALLPPGRSGATITALRDGRPLGSVDLPASPWSQGGLPDCLVAIVDSSNLLPAWDWSAPRGEGRAWQECLAMLQAAVPEVARLLPTSAHPLAPLAWVRLLGWLPREHWPSAAEAGLAARFCLQGDGVAVTYAEAMERLQASQPVEFAVEANHGSAWNLTRALADELAAVWGPSRLQEVAAARDVAEFGPGDWLHVKRIREGPADGEVVLESHPGPAHLVYVQHIVAGQALPERPLSLAPGSAESRFRLRARIEAPPDFPLDELLRSAGCEPDWPREWLWERISGEESRGALGPVRRRWQELPVFAVGDELWNLLQLRAHLREARIGYVVGEGSPAGLGPVLVVNPRELQWLKTLINVDDLMNVTHLQPKKKTPQPAAALPEIPRLPYVLECRRPGSWQWGVQPEFNGLSRIAVWHQGQKVEQLTLDWRFQVQAWVESSEFTLQTDGTLCRDEKLADLLDALRNDIEEQLSARAPLRYRAELAVWCWGLPSEWARLLARQPLLTEARGGLFSLQDWMQAWQTEGELPYLSSAESPDTLRDLVTQLPERPVALLSPELARSCSRSLPRVFDYAPTLRSAWSWMQGPAEPPLAQGSWSATARLQLAQVTLQAHPGWTRQRVRWSWRGRLLRHWVETGWPGFDLDCDCSQLLVGGELPGVADLAALLQPYRDALQAELAQLQPYLGRFAEVPADLLDETAPFEGDGPVRRALSEARTRAANRERSRFAPVARALELWWGVADLEVEVEGSGAAPLRWTDVDGTRRAFLVSEHRWLRGRPMEEVALLRLCWLGARTPEGAPRAARIRADLLAEWEPATRADLKKGTVPGVAEGAAHE